MKYTCSSAAVVMCILLGACSPGSDGPTVTTLDSPAIQGSSFPRVTATGGDVVLSWLEPAGEEHVLRFAHWQGDGWGEPGTVSTGRDWFINWADFPSVVASGSSNLAAHWLIRKSGNTYAYDIATALSADGGATWTTPRMLNDDDTPTEHGFVSVFPMPGDAASFQAVWLDGRITLTDTGGMTLRTADLNTNGDITDSELIDDLVCDCCQTDSALAASGPVVVYRNRTEGEIRDIHVTRFIDGTWEADRPVAEDGWHIAGCPVNGPAVAADGDRVAVAWYTGAGSQPTVRLAFSEDSAAQFATPIEVATGPVMGRVDVVVLTAGDAIVSWIENSRTDGGVIAEIRARRVGADGTPGEDFLIARTGAGRPSGFPQMVLLEDRLLVAWTDTTREAPQVRTATVTLR